MRKFLPFKVTYAKSQGFTLIELLTVLTILGVIGIIVVAIVTMTLRGSKKSDMLENARQNGDNALSQVVKGIRYADSINDPTSCVSTTTVSSITVTSLSDNAQTTFACANNTISSNSASLIDTSTLSVTNCSFVCSQSSSAVPPTITIQYTLSPKTTNNLVENNFSVPFQSSVTMRNF
ncbi:MAG: prepilin-type N-terminal cleavage/methylation domain-containing protein [Candidatus Levyibacteriota bacterium]